MVISEVLAMLRQTGPEVSESQIRWAIKTNKISRPRLDGSLRFDFSEANVAEIAAHFRRSRPVPA